MRAKSLSTHSSLFQIFNNKHILNTTKVAKSSSLSILNFLRSITIMSDSQFTTPRLVAKKIFARAQNEGDGAIVRRSIGRFVLKLNLLLTFYVFHLLGVFNSCKVAILDFFLGFSDVKI